MELAEIYSRAADYIEEYGWCQNVAEDVSGKVCLYGGLRRVAPYSSAICALGTLNVVLGGKTFLSDDTAVIWNDTPGRTKEEVIAFLREQAVKAGLTVPATHIIEIPEPEPLEVPVQPEPETVPVEEPDLVPA